ncbi:alpha/beta hydrolase [Stomatohabitans albus]|uniref:alpha/beta fold hydrolase n=1 Tax=Stomatohabitans albus TaxID=3110766 RepID=UPI00300CA1D8
MSNNQVGSHRTRGYEGLLYRETGPSIGRPIVFLHGWPGDSSSWTEVMALAADRGFRCLAFDLPGVDGSKVKKPNDHKTELARRILHTVEELRGRVDHHAWSGLTLTGWWSLHASARTPRLWRLLRS